MIAIRQINRPVNNLLVLVFFFMVGGVHGAAGLNPPEDTLHISSIVTERMEVSVTGTLLRNPEIGPEKTNLLMDVAEIIFPDGTIRPARGRIKLSLRGVPPANILPGELFLARAHLSPAYGYGTPGAFDYKSYLSYQSIWATGWIKSPLLLMRLRTFDKQPFFNIMRFLPERARYQINRALSRLDLEQASIYKAIITGDRSSLSPATLEDFKASGIIHLLAISGMHMGLLALCTTLFFGFLLKRSQWIMLHLPVRKVAAGLSLIPLTAYALIAGFHPPVIRALIMVTVFIAALLVDRQWFILNNVAIAALIILAIKPTLLFTASFQLSFGAVSAIALFSPMLAELAKTQTENSSVTYSHGETPTSPFRAVFARLQCWGLFSLLISGAAFLGTAPILAYHFNRISLISPIATLTVEPFLCLWSLLLGLAACLFLPFSPQTADVLLQMGGLGIHVSTRLASFFASLPYSSIWLPTPGIIETTAWYAMVVLLANGKRISRPFLLGAAALCCTVAAAAFLHSPPTDTSKVSVLDVGQGSAIVLQLPGNQTFLIDGGKKQSGSRQTFNIGENVIAPFLWQNKVTKIKAVIISHPHADHYNGLSFILNRFHPETIWLNTLEGDEGTFQELLGLAKHLNIPVKIAKSTTTIFEDGAVRLTAFTAPAFSDVQKTMMPPSGKNTTKEKKRAQNNQSLLLKLKHGQHSFLFSGDIEKEAELNLTMTTELQSDILVAPHHGSATSSSRVFLEAVRPKYIAVSAGRYRPDHFPAPSSMERYRELDIETMVTAQHGTIFFETDGENLQVNTYKKNRTKGSGLRTEKNKQETTVED